MQIVQITDLHIGKEGEDTFGIDVRGNFRALLERIQVLQPDYLVLTGDLCFRKGNEIVFQWVREQLLASGIPFEVISGNHDESAMLARVFGYEDDLHDKELYFSRQWGGHTILFMDTSVGRMSDAQWAWLQEQYSGSRRAPLVFMHHPPTLASVPYMDLNFPFRQTAEFESFCRHLRQPVAIFCGHYHVEKTLLLPQVSIHITPSSFFQIAQHTEAFQVDHRRPGMRHIEVDEKGVLKTTVYYI